MKIKLANYSKLKQKENLNQGLEIKTRMNWKTKKEKGKKKKKSTSVILQMKFGIVGRALLPTCTKVSMAKF